MRAEKNRRILVIDDNRGIHDDFRKILTRGAAVAGLDELEAALFGAVPERTADHYLIDSAYQGPEGAEMVRAAAEANAPYALAFVDMRMPPSWDGVETIEAIWQRDSCIQIVLCTAYSDCSWDDLHGQLGATDRLLILKKPFDVVEVRQLASALTEKWQLARDAEALRASLLFDLAQRRELERLKDEFVSTVSHELRTPLTSIRGGLGLLEGGVLGPLPGDVLEIVRIARIDAERLTRLINDMLDLDKISAGKLTLEKAPVSVARIVASAIDGLRDAAETAGVELRARGVLEATVEGDEDRLVQVLTNLISNAIKFSPSRGVIDIGVEKAEPDRLRFFVSDQGAGIAEAHRSRLFGKFQQLDGSDARYKSGTGLGLAISKAIVEQHGGEIGVSTRVGRGSTFWFELPCAPAGK